MPCSGGLRTTGPVAAVLGGVSHDRGRPFGGLPEHAPVLISPVKAILVGLAVCLATTLGGVTLAGCGSASAPSTSSSAGAASADKAILSKLSTESGAFTDAAVAWDQAYKTGNRSRFLAVEQQDTARMTAGLNAMFATSL